MSRKIRITAIAMAILAFFFFVGSPFQQAAEAIAIVDDAIIAIIIAGLAACGITFVTTGAYDNLGNYVDSLFTEYAASQGLTPAGVLNGAQSGSNRLGELIVNNRIVLIIDSFGRWLKSRFSMSNNGSYTLVGGGAFSSVSGVTFYKLPWSSSRNPDNYIPVSVNGTGGKLWLYGNHQNADEYYVAFSSDNHILVISTSQYYGGQYIRILSSSGSLIMEGSYPTNQASYNGIPTIPWYYYNGPNALLPNSINAGSYISADTWNDLRQALASGISDNNDKIIVNTGNVVLPQDDPEYDVGDGALIDVGASWGESYSDITGVTIPGVFSEGNVASTSITYDGESAVEEQIVDSPSQSVSSNPSDYQAPGLQNVFPFCIPFDIYAFFECLAADPVAPSFTWRFYVPGICDEELELDLSEFDAVAQIVRTMELLAFIVGLALVTRNRFLRG